MTARIPVPAVAAPLARRPVSRPVGAVLVLLVAWWAVVAGTAVVVRVAAPGASPLVGALVAIGALTVLAVTLAVRWRHRRGQDAASLGLVPPARWRRRGLLLLPLLLALAPLARGVRWELDPGTAAVLVIGYLLTGFTEELAWRGTALQLLRPLGHPRAVLFGSVLFGAGHLTNVLFRDSVALVAAQAFGAFCFGVGYAAVRLRTGALWPLMIAHLLTDLLPHLGRLPAIPVFVAQDVVLLAVGLVLLRERAVDPGA